MPPIVEQLEAVRRIAKESIYETKNYNQLYLMSAELLNLYGVKLLNDGSFTLNQQSVIFRDIIEVSKYIIDTVARSTGELDRIQSK